MSYILDALRKSEQERQRGKVPDIHGAATEASGTHKKTNLWPLVTVMVVVANLGILLFFGLKLSDDNAVQPQPQPAAVDTAPAYQQPESQQPPTQASKPAPVAASKPAVIEPAVPAPRVEQPVVIKPTPAADNREQGAESSMPSVGYLPQLEELPAYERDGIPDMTFSSHMFSSIPKYRSIIINGKRLKEGQFLNDEIQVREITDSGVVLSRGATLFEVDVLGRWAQ